MACNKIPNGVMCSHTTHDYYIDPDTANAKTRLDIFIEVMENGEIVNGAPGSDVVHMITCVG